MGAFTSFLNLYKPGGGSTGNITPDEVADIDKLNLNFDAIDAFASSIDGRVSSLESPAWTTLASLASGWAVTDSVIRYRKQGTTVKILPFLVGRTVNQTISPGDSGAAPYIVGVLPEGFRPEAKTSIGAGSIGVAGVLGASRWFALPTGEVYFNSLVTSGTMLTGGAIQNHVGAGPLSFLVP